MKNLQITFCFLFIFLLGFSQNPTIEIDARSKTSDLLEALISNKKCVGIAAGFSIGGDTAIAESAGFQDADSQVPFSESRSVILQPKSTR